MAGIGAAIRGISKILLNKSKKISPTIKSVKTGKRLKEKRDIQDSVVKTKDKVMESLPAEGKLSVRNKVKLSDTNKKIAKILD